ncbi:ECF transporter S component [Xylocopilactobacillus apis]|uniref:Membrane protein n=1 Tax=Xylocopilactobacillus apis TaxID=2932183 RepID=A0AAU9CVC9_9LACO|nr:ECF transporter S component [Xylocopilactobacillus apis]BDR56346.1 membrane protein [Xylocopilactobacillus apis]
MSFGNHKKIFRIAILSVFIALIIAQSFLPFLGYITLIPGFPQVTTLHLTVILAGLLLGPLDGLIIGFFWGLTSLIVAYTTPPGGLAVLIFQNPIISIIPRILTGLIAGMIYKPFKKLSRFKRSFGAILASIFGTSVNTIGVILLSWLLIAEKVVKFQHISGNFFIGLLSIFMVNFVLEIILSVIVCPIISELLVDRIEQR